MFIYSPYWKYYSANDKNVTDDHACAATADRKGNNKAKGTGNWTKYYDEPSSVAQARARKEKRKHIIIIMI